MSQREEFGGEKKVEGNVLKPSPMLGPADDFDEIEDAQEYVPSYKRRSLRGTGGYKRDTSESSKPGLISPSPVKGFHKDRNSAQLGKEPTQNERNIPQSSHISSRVTKGSPQSIDRAQMTSNDASKESHTTRSYKSPTKASRKGLDSPWNQGSLDVSKSPRIYKRKRDQKSQGEQSDTSKYFIESENKPVWLSPSAKITSGLLSAAVISPRKMSISSPSRAMSTNSPTPSTPSQLARQTQNRESQSGPSTPTKNYKLPTEESNAWSLLDTIHLGTPKLIRKITPKSTPRSTRSVRSASSTPSSTSNLALPVNYEGINQVFEKLITTPKKSRQEEEKVQVRLQPSPIISPRKQKTYSEVRSFQKDSNNEESLVEDEDFQDSRDQIQDINQLRINGLSSKYTHELEYLIDDFQSLETGIMRSALLEITLKLMRDQEFHKYLEIYGLPKSVISKILTANDFIITFCFTIICYKLKRNDQLILSLQNHNSLLNNSLFQLSKSSFEDSKPSKITQTILKELLQSLESQFASTTPQFYLYLFLETFRPYLNFDISLVDLNTAGDLLVINLSTLESVLSQESPSIPSNFIQKLTDIVMSTSTDKISVSCQILALKSCILISISDIESFKLHNSFVERLFQRLMKNSPDTSMKDLTLLQLGLVFNLVDLIDSVSSLENFDKLPTNDEIDNVHIAGYSSLIIGNLLKKKKLELDSERLELVKQHLQKFKKFVDKEVIINQIDDLLLYIT